MEALLHRLLMDDPASSPTTSTIQSGSSSSTSCLTRLAVDPCPGKVLRCPITTSTTTTGTGPSGIRMPVLLVDGDLCHPSLLGGPTGMHLLCIDLRQPEAGVDRLIGLLLQGGLPTSPSTSPSSSIITIKLAVLGTHLELIADPTAAGNAIMRAHRAVMRAVEHAHLMADRLSAKHQHELQGQQSSKQEASSPAAVRRRIDVQLHDLHGKRKGMCVFPVYGDGQGSSSSASCAEYDSMDSLLATVWSTCSGQVFGNKDKSSGCQHLSFVWSAIRHASGASPLHKPSSGLSTIDNGPPSSVASSSSPSSPSSPSSDPSDPGKQEADQSPSSSSSPTSSCLSLLLLWLG